MGQRVHADGCGGWRVSLVQGPARLSRGPFAEREAAEHWAALAGTALRQCIIRIGSKRFLGTAGEALQRWAIDQGTLPRAEGGTQLAPVRRLAALIAEPLCQWPLSLLQPDGLCELRQARMAAMPPLLVLVEQAALAAALTQFREFHLPFLDDPFTVAASDGVWVLDKAAEQLVLTRARQMGGYWPRLTGLLLSSGASWQDLRSACCGQAERTPGRLHLADGRCLTVSAAWLPEDQPADTPLLAGCGEAAEVMAGFSAMGRHLGHASLRPEALQLTALVAALNRNCHLDEVLWLAGATEPRQG